MGYTGYELKQFVHDEMVRMDNENRKLRVGNEKSKGSVRNEKLREAV